MPEEIQIQIQNHLKKYLLTYLKKYYYSVNSYDINEIINETLYKCSLKYYLFSPNGSAKVTTWAFGFAKKISMNYFRKKVNYEAKNCSIDNIHFFYIKKNYKIEFVQQVYRYSMNKI